jgi:cell division protein FtsZ
MHIEFGENEQQAMIKVIGVGGGGGNAVNNMIVEQLEGVDFIAVNTDAQALEANPAPHKLKIGNTLTKGLGAGGIPDHGRKAALEDVNLLEESLAGADMVFVAAGMGGGTGTGAAPIVAQVARDAGALTVGVVTRPFRFEGRKRTRLAEEGLENLTEAVDTLITIPNNRLLQIDETLTVKDAFRVADKVLSNAVRGISDLITIRGEINVDFADVKTIMTHRGRALMGTGYGSGERRTIQAAEMAINSPLLEDVAIDGAMGILINITGGQDLTMSETNEAASMIEEVAHEDAHIIFGHVILDEPSDDVKITVIATGFGMDEASTEQQARLSVGAQPGRGSLYGSRPARERTSTVPISTGRLSESPEQVQVPAGGRISTVQRTTASSDRDLDIPAFIRKQSND